MVCGKLTCTSFVLTILILALVHSTFSQNYHFSNGWYPGKKRSSNASPINNDSGSRRSPGTNGALDETCNISPYAVLLINRIVQDEVARIQKSCTPDIPSGLNDILESAASTLESDSKW